jgi:hypothetical protein
VPCYGEKTTVLKRKFAFLVKNIQYHEGLPIEYGKETGACHTRRPLERSLFPRDVRPVHERQSTPQPKCRTYYTEFVSQRQAI